MSDRPPPFFIADHLALDFLNSIASPKGVPVEWLRDGRELVDLRPIAEAAADLVCSVDFRLIRACEGSPCTLVFLDRTKAHSRRWCRMAVCGNRAKAAAHRARQRGK
jgi:predicted RNA-binding Zn ribbon-like protein